MKKTIMLTIALISFAAQAEDYVPGKNYPVALRDESATLDDWTVIETNKPKPEPEKKAETKKSGGVISSPTTALVAGSALDLTKTILVGPSAKSEGGSKSSPSTWTGNMGFDIQNQGLDQTLFGSTSNDITNVGGGTTQIQFAGGGSSGAQQVNKKK